MNMTAADVAAKLRAYARAVRVESDRRYLAGEDGVEISAHAAPLELAADMIFGHLAPRSREHVLFLDSLIAEQQEAARFCPHCAENHHGKDCANR